MTTQLAEREQQANIIIEKVKKWFAAHCKSFPFKITYNKKDNVFRLDYKLTINGHKAETYEYLPFVDFIEISDKECKELFKRSLHCVATHLIYKIYYDTLETENP